MEFPLTSETGKRYRLEDRDGERVRVYESGAEYSETQNRLIVGGINQANAKQLAEKSHVVRREKHLRALEMAAVAAVNEIEPDLNVEDKYEAAAALLGRLIHEVYNGGNAGVKAYGEIVKDLGLRDEERVRIQDSQGNRFDWQGRSFDELLSLLNDYGFDNSNYQKHDLVDGEWNTVTAGDQATVTGSDSGGDSDSGEEKAYPPTSE